MAQYCDHGGYAEHRIGDGECALCEDIARLKSRLALAEELTVELEARLREETRRSAEAMSFVDEHLGRDEHESWNQSVERAGKQLRRRAPLQTVATEAAAMLAETNHGGLTFARSESMRKALEAAGVPIPAQCSACPHGH